MYRCPSCNFLVQVEWNVCRRCGTPLPLDLREPIGQSARVPPLPRRAAPLAAGAVEITRPDAPDRADTFLPGRPATPAARPPAERPPAERPGPDTFLPHPAAPGAPMPRSRVEATVQAIRDLVDRLVHRAH